MRLLLIMPNFFDYPEVIKNELQNMGYEVDFFDDRPSTNALVKAIIRINKNLISYYIESYFKKIYKKIKENEYDIVLLISGQSLSFSEQMIKTIRENQRKALFVLYQWDSIGNFPYIVNMHKYFDKCYSFDKKDVSDYECLEFLPLFYSSRYEKIGEIKKNKYKYDFTFIGTAHPKKYKMISEISKELKDVYKNQFIYFYLPSLIVYIYRKIKNPEFKNAKYKDFKYKKIDGKLIEEIFEDTRCVLDSPQDGQLGLTMRVLETLGAKKKLITTNKDIKNYDFYDEQNIYIYDKKIDLNSVFFNTDYKEIDKEIYHKYSLRSWLLELLKTQ